MIRSKKKNKQICVNLTQICFFFFSNQKKNQITCKFKLISFEFRKIRNICKLMFFVFNITIFRDFTTLYVKSNTFVSNKNRIAFDTSRKNVFNLIQIFYRSFSDFTFFAFFSIFVVFAIANRFSIVKYAL